MAYLPKIIIILGPTASGKSSLSLDIARKIDGEIIAADSRTIYKRMNIGTAKPEGKKVGGATIDREQVEREGIHTAAEISITDLFTEKPYVVEGIPHWGIDLVDPDVAYSAAEWKSYAEQKIADILSRGKVPMIVGGTGLYISSLIDNWTFTEVPPNPTLRAELEAFGNEELHERLQEQDAEAAEWVDISNRPRLIRSLEILASGQDSVDGGKEARAQKYDALQIGIQWDREELYERINLRVDQMIAEGLVNEVRDLKQEYETDAPGMTGIGYRQIGQFLDGYITLRDAIDLIKRDSRRYAKRQMTWFKRDNRIVWIEPGEDVIPKIQSFLAE